MAVYGLSSVLGRILNYLLVPLYTEVFQPGEYGVVTEIYAYAAFLNVLYIYGLETTYFRFSSQGKKDEYFNLAFTSIFIGSIVFSGGLCLFSEPLAQMLGSPVKGRFIRWLALILAIDAWMAIPFARLRQEGKAIPFARFKLVTILLNIGLNLFFLTLCPWLSHTQPDHVLLSMYDIRLGVDYVFISNLIANGFCLLFFIPTWLKIKLRFNAYKWRKMMVYTLPILIMGFAGVTNEMLSRAMLKHRLPENFYLDITNSEALGIFGACYKLSIFMTLAVQAFRYAFEPFFFARAFDKNSPQLFSRIMTWFVIFTSFVWVSISVSLPYIAPIFLRQDSYLKALDTVPWLLGGGLFLGMVYNLSLWYKLTDKTVYGAYISLAGTTVTLGLNWLLIPILGYKGSAITTFVTYLVMVVLSAFWGRKHYPIPYRWLRIVAYIWLAMVSIAINEYWKDFPSVSFLVVVIFLTLPIITERKTLFKKIKQPLSGNYCL